MGLIVEANPDLKILIEASHKVVIDHTKMLGARTGIATDKARDEMKTSGDKLRELYKNKDFDCPKKLEGFIEDVLKTLTIYFESLDSQEVYDAKFWLPKYIAKLESEIGFIADRIGLELEELRPASADITVKQKPKTFCIQLSPFKIGWK